MKVFAVVVLLCLICSFSSALPIRKLAEAERQNLQQKLFIDFGLVEKWFHEQRVDHFNFENVDVFSERYLISDKHWKNKEGPLFFYTGNEGDIEMFAENTNFIFELAEEFGALVVFAEHRFYGKSFPFPEKHAFDHPQVGVLTSQQALADYVYFIRHLRKDLNCSHTMKVIAFGGSYGGMLSAWARIKYPGTFDGALAASAPILYFGDLVDPGFFNEIITNDFTSSSKECSSAIRAGFRALYSEDPAVIQKQLKLCTPPQTAAEIAALNLFVNSAIGYMAMVDYPYPTSFLRPLPTWPVAHTCKLLADADLSIPVSALYYPTQVYYNTTGEMKCFNTSTPVSPTLGMGAWDYQACTEMVFPTSQDGVRDFFYPPEPWSLAAYTKQCLQTGTTPRPLEALDMYGGKKLAGVTQIIFSNGELDPWFAGGVTEPIPDSTDLHVFVIKNGAHHLDLRGSHPNDPETVIAVRRQERDIIGRWLA
eukprot:GCRY01000555.1.p1 GENE.GCRY01000555.1~~GCRY01000555.1.p1  ORF type:complete len:498 (-),score=114.63 GCRY01000555.1:77-1513(-)